MLLMQHSLEYSNCYKIFFCSHFLRAFLRHSLLVFFYSAFPRTILSVMSRTLIFASTVHFIFHFFLCFIIFFCWCLSFRFSSRQLFHMHRCHQHHQHHFRVSLEISNAMISSMSSIHKYVWIKKKNSTHHHPSFYVFNSEMKKMIVFLDHFPSSFMNTFLNCNILHHLKFSMELHGDWSITYIFNTEL